MTDAEKSISGPFDRFGRRDFNLFEFSLDEGFDPDTFLAMPKAEQWERWLEYQAQCLWVRNERERAHWRNPSLPYDSNHWRQRMREMRVRGA